MSDRSERQQARNRTHQEKPTSALPEAEVVSLAECLWQQLPPGVPVLDAGCGRGRNVFYLAQAGFAVYACDLSPLAIAVARRAIQQRGWQASFQVADLTHLPYPDGSFAAAVCIHVLPYHFKADIIEGIRELQRVLRPNGQLYFDLLACDDAEYGCGRELEQHTFLDPDNVPLHFSSRQEVDAVLGHFADGRATRFMLESATRIRIGWKVWARK